MWSSSRSCLPEKPSVASGYRSSVRPIRHRESAWSGRVCERDWSHDMKDSSQLLESIDRYQRGFWDRRATDRPTISVYPYRCLVPVTYLKQPFERAEVVPSDVTSELLRTDYEDASFDRKVFTDDFMPFNSPWRGIPWLEAICGCRVGFADGALAPLPFVGTSSDLNGVPFPADRVWSECLAEETAKLVATNPPDCWVSPTIIRGVSDTLAGARGLTNFFLDLYDAPELIDRAAQRIGAVLRDVVQRNFGLVPPKQGGYGHIYGYWAPRPTFVLQEDVLGLCAPDVYRAHFLEVDACIVERLEGCILFHLHTSGYRHYRDILGIRGLAGMQITIEATGPSLRDLAPVFREVIEQMRLMLLVDAHFDELPWLLRQLPSEGLAVIVPDKFIPTEAAFRTFVADNWHWPLASL